VTPQDTIGACMDGTALTNAAAETARAMILENILEESFKEVIIGVRLVTRAMGG
jgi:hypothetical protein